METHNARPAGGVACAPHLAAVEDGRQILGEGSNAVEAMLAMAALIGTGNLRDPAEAYQAFRGRLADAAA